MSGKNALSLGLFALAITSSLPAQPYLEQNWSNATRQRFWFIDQGSRIMPLECFQRLERAGSSDKFAAGLDRYGFVPDTFNLGGPQGVPFIGFTVDAERSVGLTCAACHSGQTTIEGTKYMIEGAPAMLDFDRFLADMVDAMTATKNNPEKWARFSAGLSTTDLARFEDKYRKLVIRREINTPTFPAGFARVDAFGHIFNQVVVEHLGNDRKWAEKPDAPASYPALWDIAQHLVVQWNYSAPNLGVGSRAIGSLLRNVGEVLGVFGEMNVQKSGLFFWEYGSSANIANLMEIEDMISRVRSPKWPLPPDPAAEAAGRQVYERARCSQCHAIIDRNAPPFPYPAQATALKDVKTDPALANTFLNRRAPIGKLRGAPLFGFTLGAEAPVRNLTGHLAVGAILQREAISPVHLLGATGLVPAPPPQYKARPLNGVWATAPYLHNGSVPTLRELLIKPDKRIRKFCVGDAVYDVKNGGHLTYKDRLDAGQPCPDRTSLFDATRKGSLNQGHDYGTNLSDTEKDNLVAFLKTL